MKAFAENNSVLFLKRSATYILLGLSFAIHAQTNPVKINTYPFQFPTQILAHDSVTGQDCIFGYDYQTSVKYFSNLYFVNATTYSLNVPGILYSKTNLSSYPTMARVSKNKVYCANTPTLGSLICYDIPSNTQYLWQNNYPGGYIDGFEIYGDSIFAMIDSTGSKLDQILRIINKNTGGTIANTTIKDGFQGLDDVYGVVKKIKLFNGKLLIGGKFTGYSGSASNNNFLVYDIVAQKCSTITLNFNDTVSDIEVYNNRVYVGGSFTTVNGFSRNHLAVLNSNLTLNPTSFNILGGDIKEMEMNGKDLFMATNATTVQTMPISTGFPLNTVLIDVSVSMPPKWVTPFQGNYPATFKIDKGRLFMADKAGTNEVYCLTPTMPSFFSLSTNVVCQGAGNKNYAYTMPYGASTYSWTYSGTGVSLFPGTNTATLSFGLSATSGTLMAFTRSLCGSNSDTIKLFVNVYPIPAPVASTPKDTLNCVRPKTAINCSWCGPNTVYSWSGPGGYSSTKQNDSTGYLKPGAYAVTVTNTISGCSNLTFITIKMDTLRPNITLPPPVFINCNPDSSLLNGSSSSSPTNIKWIKQGSGVYHNNPYYTKSIGNYFMVVKNTQNGCRDSSILQVQSNQVIPDKSISSHTFVNTIIPIDTVTCLKPNVTVVGSSTTTGTDIKWRNISGGVVSNNPINVTGQGNFKLIVTNTVNGCADSSIIAFVAQDLTPPGITVLTPSPNIPCGSTTVALNAVCSVTYSILQWSGPFSFSSSNPAIVNTVGKYLITATNTVNGCIKKDSVNVTNTNSLSINAGNDTTVCKNSTVNFMAKLTSSVSGVTYTWSTGGSGQTISVSPSISTSYIVYGSNGTCSGNDTVKVIIPSDIQDSVVASKGCDGNNFGSLSIFAKGGITPYRYSVNSGAFTTQSSYTNMPFGNYSIVIKDSIGCTKVTSTTIDQNSSLPQPVFIASTQNTKGDTLVFVDLTNPKADSVQWILPAGAVRIGGDMFNPIIVFSDTGYFNITMRAFYGNCVINKTKIIHVAPNDGTFANSYNANGIKSLTLYPNPNTGLFTVNVEFYKKQNASIQIWDTQPEKYYQQNFLDTDYISLPVNVSQLENGNYILKVIGEYNSKHFNFIISK